ncbi:MAG: ABC transporter ATP-binding protein, partial [Solirubrobacteraceae bacterium]
MATTGASDRTIEVGGVWRRFGERDVLRGVSLNVGSGEVHALLGPNGAGKTTLLRIVSGLVDPTAGAVRVRGHDGEDTPIAGRVRLVPSGDRSFYERISGLENLRFFARLEGLRRGSAVARAREVLELVGLGDAADRPVGRYSHGMQKRLSFARALLTEPELLLVDEATHDLDPEGAQRVRGLTTELAARGAAILWATQRVDEIRGFAAAVTFLHGGEVRFAGSVTELIARGATARRYVLRVRNGRPDEPPAATALQRALGDEAGVAAAGDAEHFLLTPHGQTSLGRAIAALAASGYDVLS